jgi:hypothetical protein
MTSIPALNSSVLRIARRTAALIGALDPNSSLFIPHSSRLKPRPGGGEIDRCLLQRSTLDQTQLLEECGHVH